MNTVATQMNTDQFDTACPCCRIRYRIHGLDGFKASRTIHRAVRDELGPLPGGVLLVGCPACLALSMADHARRIVRPLTRAEWKLLNDCPSAQELRDAIEQRHVAAGRGY